VGVTLSTTADAQPAGKAGVSSTELADAAAATKQAKKDIAKSAGDPAAATPPAEAKKSARSKQRSVRNGGDDSSRDGQKASSGEGKSSKKARKSSKNGDKSSSGEATSTKKGDKSSSRETNSSKKGDTSSSGKATSSKKGDKSPGGKGKTSKSADRSGPKTVGTGRTADRVEPSAVVGRALASRTRKGEADDRSATRDGRPPTTQDRSPKEIAAKAGADGKPKHEPKRREPPGRSVGAPNHGRLADGAKLDPSKVLRIAPGAQRWALPVLVHALERIAGMLARDHKSPPMFVGDLSAQRGGKLGPHRSHQSGRDVDIGFYATDLKGRPVKMNRWVAFDGKGRARDGSAMRFDDARNWALIRALVEDSAIRVRYMFITQELESRIIAYATKRGAKRASVARAAEVMQSPQDVDLHDNHIHVRIDCPSHTRDVCVPESVRGYDDNAPTADVAGYAASYPAPVVASPAAEPDLTAPAQAADGAGPRAEPTATPGAGERPANEPPPVPAGAAPSDI
jgi:penicillin-insensitive murein endopeptidase